MISSMANRQQKWIEPLISLTVDFYVRLFIRVHDGAQKCHNSLTKYSHVFQCMECESHWMQPFGVHMQQEVVTDEKGTVLSKKSKKWQKPPAQDEEEKVLKQEEEDDTGKSTKTREKYQLSRLSVPSRCTICDGPLTMGGPIWNQKIHDLDFAQRLLDVARTNSDKKLPVEQREVNLGTTKRI